GRHAPRVGVANSVSLVITIDVADLAVAVDFYGRALGLHVTRRLGPDIAELGGAETPVYLTQHAARNAPTRPRHGPARRPQAPRLPAPARGRHGPLRRRGCAARLPPPLDAQAD